MKDNPKNCVTSEEAQRQGILRWILSIFLLALGLLLLRQCGEHPPSNKIIVVNAATSAVAMITPTTTQIPTPITTATMIPIASLTAGKLRYVVESNKLSWQGSGQPAYLTQLISADGRVIDKSFVDRTGNWMIDISPTLVYGENCFTIQMRDENSKVIDNSTEQCILYKEPIADLSADPVNFSYDGKIGQTTWKGSGEPNYIMRMINNEGQVIGSSLVEQDGYWSTSSDIKLPKGEHCFTIQMLDADGIIVVETESTACVTIEPAPLITTVETNKISGTYESGSTLMLTSQSGNMLGQVNVQENGSFSATCQLLPGQHKILINDEDNDDISNTVTISVKGETVFTPPPSDNPACDGPQPYGTLDGNIYTVAACEYAGLLTKRLNTTIDELRLANPEILNFSLIYKEQEIIVPLNATCIDGYQ